MYRHPECIPENSFRYLTGASVKELWSLCDYCVEDGVEGNQSLPLVCQVFMFFYRLRKNVPFQELAINFEYYDQATLDSIFYKVMIVFFSRSNPIARVWVKQDLTGTLLKKLHILRLVSCEKTHFSR